MMNRISNRVYAIIGFASAVITILPWALSNTVRVWVREHSNWLYGVLVLAIIAVIVILGYARDLNRKCQELEASTKEPSRNDVNMLREIMKQIPRDGTIMTWLKVEFFAKAIPYAKIEALDQVQGTLHMNPFEFDDRQVNAAYENFGSAIGDFRVLITRYCNFEENRKYDTLRVRPPEKPGEERNYYKEIDELYEEVEKLTSAYDEFLRTCTANGLDIYNIDLLPTPTGDEQY
jgi:hypothetical protein